MNCFLSDLFSLLIQVVLKIVKGCCFSTEQGLGSSTLSCFGSCQVGLNRFRSHQFVCVVSSARGCLRVFLFVSGCPIGFCSFLVASVVVGGCRLQKSSLFLVFSVVVGCCTFFRLFRSFQGCFKVVSYLLVDSKCFDKK